MNLRKMDWIEEQLSRAPTPNTIVHLGAGLCRELPHYIRSRAERIVLIEPNPEMLPELQKQAAAHSNVELLPVAVAAEPGRRALRLYNYPDLSSLRRPTGLIELLPGLQQTGQAIVNVIAAHTLPEQLGLKNDKNNWLVIDTPGEEVAIINNLEQHKQLSQFDRIIIRAGAESLYEGTPACEQLILQLENLGYYIEGAEDTSDRDWPHYHLRLNPKAIECRRLRRESEALSEQNAKLEEQLQQLTEQLQKQEALALERAEKLEAIRQQAQQQQQELRTALESKQKSCTQLQSKVSELSSRLQTDSEKFDQEREELIKQLNQEKAAREKAVQDAQNHLKRLAQSQQQIQRMQSEDAELLERQALIDQEMARAEGQIELIKELVFRESDS